MDIQRVPSSPISSNNGNGHEPADVALQPEQIAKESGLTEIEQRSFILEIERMPTEELQARCDSLQKEIDGLQMAMAAGQNEIGASILSGIFSKKLFYWNVAATELANRWQPKPAIPSPSREPNGATLLPLAQVIDAFNRDETGDAELLSRLYADRIVFDHSESKWYLWDGQHWNKDGTDNVPLFIDEVASQYLHAAALKRREHGEEAETLVKRLVTRAHSLHFRNRIKNILALAASQPGLKLSGHEWDANPMVLGVENGVLDLDYQSFEFRPGQPRDYIRTYAPVEWAGIDAPAGLWEQVLSEIFAADAELINFVHRLLGYGISGRPIEHIFPVFYGEGRNGKDTLLGTIGSVLGALVSPVQSEVLLDSGRNPNAATPHLCDLRGRRLVWVSESNEGARLNSAQVKLLTGGGTIKARPLYGSPIAFDPHYLLVLVTNFKPHANPDDYALWKRLLLIPFTQAFVDDPKETWEHSRDPDLSAKLHAEAPGILAWLVRGCLEWQRIGLNPPESVRAATAAYADEENTLGEFIVEMCILQPHAEAKGSLLYASYKAWSERGGISPMSITAFGKRLKKRFKTRSSHGVIYEGIGLIE